MGGGGTHGGAASSGADERTQLMPGRAGGRKGDLESIFGRLEAQPVCPRLLGGCGLYCPCSVPEPDAVNACAQEDRLVGGARRGRDERETTSSLSFESDTERDEPAATGMGAWFRRSR